MSSSTILLIALCLASLGTVLLYKRLITLRNRFLNAFLQIDVQLQRRYELIPDLVETASAYMAHEAETLTAVTQARNAASVRCRKAAENPVDLSLLGSLASAETRLNGALSRFNMLVENYPDLKADAQMRDLHEELVSADNRVAFARQAYSDAVMLYNTARERFPMLIVAGVFAFKRGDLFEIAHPDMQQVTQVRLPMSRAA